MHVKYTVRNTGNVRVTANPTIRGGGPARASRARRCTSKAMPELLPHNSLTFTADVSAFPAVHLDTTVELTPRATARRAKLAGKTATASASVGVWAIPWIAPGDRPLVIAAVLLWIWSRRRQQRAVDAKVQQAVAEALVAAGDEPRRRQPTRGDRARDAGAMPRIRRRDRVS